MAEDTNLGGVCEHGVPLICDCKQCDAPSGIPSTDLLASRAIARLAIATAMTKAVGIYATDGKEAARDFIKDRCRSLTDELIPKDANQGERQCKW